MTQFAKAEKVGKSLTGRLLAGAAIREHIGQFRATERKIKALREQREKAGQELTHQEVLRIRKEQSAQLATAFRKWLDSVHARALPGSSPGSDGWVRAAAESELTVRRVPRDRTAEQVEALLPWNTKAQRT